MSDLNTKWNNYATALNNYKESYQEWNTNRRSNIGSVRGIAMGLEEFGNKTSAVGTGSVLTGLAGGVIGAVGLVGTPFTGKITFYM